MELWITNWYFPDSYTSNFSSMDSSFTFWEIISEKIDEDTIEQEFEEFDSGNYELIIESSDNKERYVAGAIGPLPDANEKFIISSISSSCIIIGMVGLVILAIYEIRNKRKSV